MKFLKDLFFLFLFFFPQNFLFAQNINLSVSPILIDEKLNPRDIRNYEVSIKNNSDRMLYIYPLVFEVRGEKKEFSETANLERDSSLSSWIKIQRAAIKIEKGEEVKTNLSLEISPIAKAGKYHALIIFSFGSDLTDAKNKVFSYYLPEIILNVEIKENSIENLQIKKFQPEKNLFFKGQVKFLLEIENQGNKEIKSEGGGIFIYNKRGQELDFISLEFLIKPEEKKSFEIFWNAKKEIGQLKAKILLPYGKEKKELLDIVFFTILPFEILIFLVSLITILILILIKLINKKNFSSFSDKIIRPIINLKK